MRRFVLRLTAAAALFAAGVLVFNYVVMPLVIHRRATVIVPDVRGLSRAQAERELDRASLVVRVVREVHDAEVPHGFVVSQSPRPNETVREGRTVDVVVSLGARTVAVPDVRGMSLRQARMALERAGLGPGRIARVTVPGDPGERVVAFRPGAGDTLVEGSRVDLVVAVGGVRRTRMMPDLRGRDLLFVRDKLRALGFRIASVRYERREGVFPNTIVDQDPAPGARIHEGDSIELVAAGS